MKRLTDEQRRAYFELLKEYGGCNDPDDDECMVGAGITINADELCEIWLERERWKRLVELYEERVNYYFVNEVSEAYRRKYPDA